MRTAFAAAVIDGWNLPNHIFLTGDLGFMALEDVRRHFGERFINCGVAEQNMISVAAGLAREGFRCMVYSIAPFVYARPFEQIRNDLCFTSLPVCLAGNGGGYAYGHMGPTHHALEDCASLSAIGVRCLVPAFKNDISAMIAAIDSPTWLRLGREVLPEQTAAPAWSAWRKLLDGGKGNCVALGPLAGLAWEILLPLGEQERPALWACTEMPLPPLPQNLLAAVHERPLYVLEEHVREGGLGVSLAYALLGAGVCPSAFTHRYALKYPSGRYGSQNFHRAECGLDGNALHALFTGQQA